MTRTPNARQPNAIAEDWLTHDEPTSDLFRLTGPPRNKKLRNPEEYCGSADMRWRAPIPDNYERERRRRHMVKDEMVAMLDRFQWDWFSTYTLNMQAKPSTAHTMFRNH